MNKIDITELSEGDEIEFITSSNSIYKLIVVDPKERKCEVFRNTNSNPTLKLGFRGIRYCTNPEVGMQFYHDNSSTSLITMITSLKKKDTIENLLGITDSKQYNHNFENAKLDMKENPNSNIMDVICEDDV